MKTIYLIRHSLKEKNDYLGNEKVDKQKLNEQEKLSDEGKKLAYKLLQLDILKNVKEVWSSNYERAIETAKYITDEKINITGSFDERHYGDFDDNTVKEEFWINQFKDEYLNFLLKPTPLESTTKLSLYSKLISLVSKLNILLSSTNSIFLNDNAVNAIPNPNTTKLLINIIKCILKLVFKLNINLINNTVT